MAMAEIQRTVTRRLSRLPSRFPTFDLDDQQVVHMKPPPSPPQLLGSHQVAAASLLPAQLSVDCWTLIAT